MTDQRLQTQPQTSAFRSSWPMSVRIKVGLWRIVWCLLWRPTPDKCFNWWRALLLRLFGATVEGAPFLANSAFIKMPWNLTVKHLAVISPGAEIYNLGPCVLGERSSVTQYVYLCGGTHDFADPHLSLVVGRIEVGDDAFVGARATVLPGVTIGPGAVVGAGSVVTRDVPPWTICAGNPCRPIKPRAHPRAPGAAPAKA